MDGDGGVVGRGGYPLLERVHVLLRHSARAATGWSGLYWGLPSTFFQGLSLPTCLTILLALPTNTHFWPQQLSVRVAVSVPAKSNSQVPGHRGNHVHSAPIIVRSCEHEISENGAICISKSPGCVIVYRGNVERCKYFDLMGHEATVNGAAGGKCKLKQALRCYCTETENLPSVDGKVGQNTYHTNQLNNIHSSYESRWPI